MTLAYFRTQLGWLALLPFVAAPLVSAAQTQATPAPQAHSAFKSAFEGYQPYTDDQTGNWRQANDTVARIGGWRAYAREAAAEPAKSASAAPAAPTALTPEPSPKTRLEPATAKP